MEDKIKTIQELTFIMQNENCILITGSFDFVHLGHLRFIHKAKELFPTYKLVMILLSDNSIKIRKGKERPLFNEDERIEFASYLADIDYVSIWEEEWEELRSFVLLVKPKAYVINSDDPGLENKVKIMHSAGGQVIILKKSDDYSTSKIIDRIKNL